MKRKIIPFILSISTIFIIVPRISANPQIQSPSPQQLLDTTDVNFGVHKGFNRYWGTFKWKVEGNTATLLPTSNNQFIDPEDIPNNVRMADSFALKIIGANGLVKTEFKAKLSEPLQIVAKWLAKQKLVLNKEGLQVINGSPFNFYSVSGEIVNYNGHLTLDRIPKSVYRKFAIVPADKGLYARYMDQDMMDVNPAYTIAPKTAPDKYVNFDATLNILVTERQRKWSLVYDESKFAYKINPYQTDIWNSYTMYWENPASDDVRLEPPYPLTYNLGEFWYFKRKPNSNEFELTPFTDFRYALNLDANQFNISAAFKNGGQRQRFLLIPEPKAND